MSELAEKLEASGQYSSVFARPKARVPIVALHDAATGLKSDICMCNRLALLNSRLLRCYMVRVRVRIRVILAPAALLHGQGQG